MNYRREIDGLRALAVFPVIFFHAGFETFSGGFVGVDVFFVISGYLITTIIMTELTQGKFSIINFYERRARRILPALFFVMLISLFFSYFLLMPDEFKNFGQSLVATSLFQNNLLLALTTGGYWDLTSEFKPLLHTWSLGVEEQYYVIIPVLLVIFWRIGKSSITYLLWSIFILSFFFALWSVNISPKWAFYILPTRAWEICIGALAAIYLRRYANVIIKFKYSNFMSLLGVVLIVISIFVFDNTIAIPGIFLLIPTIGAVLVIIFCQSQSISYKLLGSKTFVLLGLFSYSLYLWHQPMFAFLRIYSVERPSSFKFFGLIPLVFILSYFTWKFIESPFRNRACVSRGLVFTYSVCGSIFFIVVGLYLNKSYGMASRVFHDGVLVADMDKRIYNERAFKYKKEKFSDTSLTKILILGDSFARDFVNITLENFDVTRAQIIYRDDLEECIDDHLKKVSSHLFIEADVIVFAHGNLKSDCYLKDIEFAKNRAKDIFYIGTKDFGYNLNWLIRLDKEQRKNQFNPIAFSAILADKEMARAIPSEYYISLLGPTLVKKNIPITDHAGRMLSTDRKHLTKYGALFFGKKAIADTRYADLFKHN
jgi:peptidoglycan/LPS O-acetylase OafA/YrhL